MVRTPAADEVDSGHRKLTNMTERVGGDGGTPPRLPVEEASEAEAEAEAAAAAVLVAVLAAEA